MNTNEKRDWERAVKKSVSMPKILLDEAETRRRETRLTTLSDYIQWLIREDVNRNRRMAA
jgi:metal-responsive CopG/Arc/MetJ family transcriptional regulator